MTAIRIQTFFSDISYEIYVFKELSGVVFPIHLSYQLLQIANLKINRTYSTVT